MATARVLQPKSGNGAINDRPWSVAAVRTCKQLGREVLGKEGVKGVLVEGAITWEFPPSAPTTSFALSRWPPSSLRSAKEDPPAAAIYKVNNIIKTLLPS
jgi:hypothetical protein